MNKLKTRRVISGTCITLLTLGTLYCVPNTLTDTTIAITSPQTNETNSTTEQPSTEEPSTEQPSTEEPSTEQPSTEEPSTEQPSTEEPSTEQPSTEEPTTEQPSTEEPSTEEPSTEEPTTEQPSTEEPTTEQPSTEEPSTEEPSTEEPSTEQPSTEEPSTEEPSTEEPSTEQPAPPPKPDEPTQGNSDESHPGGDRGQPSKPGNNTQSVPTPPGSNRPEGNEVATGGGNRSNFNRDNNMLNPYQNQLLSQYQNETKRNAFSVANFNPLSSDQYYQLLDRNMLALISGEFGSNDNRKRLFSKSFLNHQNEDKVREINQNGENLEAQQQGKQNIGNHGNLSLIKYMGVGLASIIFIVAFSIVIWKRIRKMN
ncbi:SdrH family protein [Staphylococcus agnetis]|uniref:SdrH family protein n=2 Tax=Staphylococcus agnetis TaxID=985762 RepID=UPI0018E519C0|nr:SdrH family protein [Staphylococcus agnetis]MCO4357138.1 SdrH family protein [Staphylococcus agnetis]